MNVFTDFHHASLLKSFILLFEKRMGGSVYRPIGMEWAQEGFWKVYDHPATQAQYLGIGAATPDGTPPLNEVVRYTIDIPSGEGIYYCKDIEGNETNKAITFRAFMDTPFDYVIASLPQHIQPFRKLCDMHPSHPKLIYQIGNEWNISSEDERIVNGIMASAKISKSFFVPVIEYHQEFDLDIFYATRPIILKRADGSIPPGNIYSFVNVFNGQSHFAQDWQLFEQIERQMPTWVFRSYGGQCRDGSCDGSRALANKMREARFIWHTKNGGDGYGHVLHNAAAVGRPMIVKKSYYSGKLGESLLIDGETCINIDGLSNQQIVDKIMYYSEPERYGAMCQAVYTNFKKVVDFDAEYVKIQEFLQQIS